MNIPLQAERALARLEQHGFEAYAVGGCVRDLLRGAVPADYDICTNALPEQTMEVFSDCKVIETGLQHGTVTVVLDHMHMEVTTYRLDGDYGDNRHPDHVTFTPSLAEDLRRRDFTVNAMAMDRRGRVVDLFDGQQDLQNGVIRCVGDADTRFHEDGLRVMRALRFAAVLGFQIETLTAQAVRRDYELLEHIAWERIREELNRTLMGKAAAQTLRSYAEVFGYIMPELQPMFGFEQHNPYHLYDVWEHTLHALEHSAPQLEVRLAVLLHDCGKPAVFTRDEAGVGHFYNHGEVSGELAAQLLARLTYDNDTKELVTKLVRYHDMPISAEPKVLRRRLNRFGETGVRLLLQVKRADVYGQGVCMERLAFLDEVEAALEQVLKEKQCFSLKDLAVDGRDVIACGITDGREIGAELDRLLQAVLEDSGLNRRETLLAMIREDKHDS